MRLKLHGPELYPDGASRFRRTLVRLKPVQLSEAPAGLDEFQTNARAVEASALSLGPVSVPGFRRTLVRLKPGRVREPRWG